MTAEKPAGRHIHKLPAYQVYLHGGTHCGTGLQPAGQWGWGVRANKDKNIRFPVRREKTNARKILMKIAWSFLLSTSAEIFI